MLRTDLALESHQIWRETASHTAQLSGVHVQDTQVEGYPVHRVDIVDEAGAAALGKPVGTYLTLELTGLLRREEEGFSRGVRALSTLLTPLLPPQGLALVVGLGNRAITPDLLGPLAADKTLVTRHLVEHLPTFSSYRPVAVLTPGVLATTGVESAALVKAVCDHLHPTCVIVMDALCARGVERLCTTVQLSDTGLTPGSGVGNHRFSLTAEILGVPVLSLGVPTVIDGATLVADLLGQDMPSPLTTANLFVTPQEIDSRVADLGRVMGFGVSHALNPHLSVEDLVMLLE